jgi:hypothetical protein
MAHPLPLQLAEIDREWLTQALRTRVPDATVQAFEIGEVIHGTCTKVRIHLELNEAGRNAGIAESVVLKGGFEEHSRFLMSTKVEPLAYRDLLPSGLNTPRCYFADFDEDRHQGIVIMDDLDALGATIGHPLRPRSHDEVAETLSMLAQFHARSWNCAPFEPGQPLGWMPSPPLDHPRIMGYLEPEVWLHYVAMPRGAAASTSFHDPAWAQEAVQKMKLLAARVPNCIVHGDTHLGNTYACNGSFGFFDVTPRRGPAIGEASYHITLSMDMAERSIWERHLLKHYLNELRSHGVEDVPSFEDAAFQAGVFLIEGYCLVLVNDTKFMPEPLITAYCARLSSAMLESDTKAKLGKIN